MTWTHAWRTIVACIKEPPMNERPAKPLSDRAPDPAATRSPDDERPVKPTRPPRVEDFVIDRDKTDPLRRFRF